MGSLRGMNTLVSEDVREIESLRSHVAMQAVACQRSEREMWRAIGRLADAYQSLVFEMELIRRYMLWIVCATVVSAICSGVAAFCAVWASR